MKNFLFLTVMSVAFASCEKDKVKGSGAVTTEQRNVSDFSAIFVSGSTNVFITQGNNFEVQVKAYSNLLPYLETKSQNGKLTIGYKSNSNIQNDNSQVFIVMPSLNSLSVSGSGNINATGNFPTVNQFNAFVSGSGNINMDTAEVDDLTITISGSGNVKSYPLRSQNAEININGSGNAEVYVSQNLNAAINGSGSVYYKGNPPTVNSKISGSGKMIPQ